MAARLFRLHGGNSGGLGQLFFINNSKFFLQYSTTAPTSTTDPTRFFVDYLINSLGFSKEKAISTNNKVTKSTDNPQAVLNLFEKTGLDKTHIAEIVSSVPSLLACDVEQTLKPKIEILNGIGLYGSDLVKVITGSVTILKNTDVLEMKCCVSYLREILGSDEYVVKAVKKKPTLLSVKSCERLKTNIVYFQSIGFSDEEIKKFLVRNPYTLLANPENIVENVEKLRNDFSMSRGSGMFIHGLDVLVSQRECTIDTKLGIFRDFGWSQWDIIKLVQRLPYCLRLSEKKLRAGLKYYMVEHGFKSSYLASHPTLLMFSMKERVLPRLEFMRNLVEKKLYHGDYTLYTLLLPSESKFHESYVLPYKDSMPDVYELYKKIPKQGKAKN